MRRFALILFVILSLLSPFADFVSVSAKDNWVTVRSKNFLLVGNANENQVRQVAVQLEQFREIFPRLFPKLNFSSTVPTTVVVFKNSSSYKPFRPSEHTAGYFQAGTDVNYISLTLEVQRDETPYNVIFHEYTHLIMSNHNKELPLWLDEGLAEYYSTYTLTDDNKIVLGRPIANHVYLLRQNKMLPLRTLFSVTHDSPHYNERNKQTIFYAESWALLHYLILGNNGQRANQIGKFIELMAANVSMEDAFQQAYGMTIENMEHDLRNYIQNDRYTVMFGKLENSRQHDQSMETVKIGEAEANAYLGDLLLHSNRPESEVYLQKALAIDPAQPMANASLGMLRVKQGLATEARASLERAVAGSPQNYLTQYYYAYALSRDGNSDMQNVSYYDPATAMKIRSAAKTAIELRPDFPESYALLALVNLVTDKNLDETLTLVKGAQKLAPGHPGLAFMRAQIHLRRDEFEDAKRLLEPLENNPDSQVRQQIKSLMVQILAREREMKRFRELEAEIAAREQQDTTLAPKPVVVDGAVEYKENADPSFVLRGSLRKPANGEVQLEGTLVRIDCSTNGFVFVVNTGTSLVRLRTETFEKIAMKTFTEEVRGEITCGARKSERVVVCYSPSAARGSDGVLRSLEFVPKDFKLRPAA